MNSKLNKFGVSDTIKQYRVDSVLSTFPTRLSFLLRIEIFHTNDGLTTRYKWNFQVGDEDSFIGSHLSTWGTCHYSCKRTFARLLRRVTTPKDQSLSGTQRPGGSGRRGRKSRTNSFSTFRERCRSKKTGYDSKSVTEMK